MILYIDDIQYTIVCTELTLNEMFISDKAVLINVNCNIRKPKAGGHYRKKDLSGVPKSTSLKWWQRP